MLKKVKIVTCTAKRPLNYKRFIGETVEVVKQDGSTLIVNHKGMGMFLVLTEDVETVE